QGGLPRVGDDVDVVVTVHADGRAPLAGRGGDQVVDGQVREDGAATVDDLDLGADVRDVRLGTARVDDDVAGQVVRRVAAPRVHDLPAGQVEGVEPGGVILGDVEPLLVRGQGDAAHHVAGFQLAQHLAGLRVDLADGAGVLVGDVEPAAVARGDSPVRL